MEKECFKCGEVKPLTEFYKHKEMKDGHLNKCKDCAKLDVFGRTDEEIEKRKYRDRNRPNHDDRAKQHLQRMNRLRINDPEKFKRMQRHKNELTKKLRHNIGNAHCKVHRAVQAGKINKPSACSKCGIECSPHGHHPDYTKPLEVVWLCVRCHADEHIEINEMKRSLK